MILADSKDAVKAAAEALLIGHLVALPTDTVYGLAVLASDRAAVSRLLRLKERPATKPLVVQVASLIAARRIAEFSPLAEKLAAAFWPGALSLVLPLQTGADIRSGVTAGRETIGLRLPDHPLMQAVLHAVAGPLAVTSANRSGQPSAKKASQVAATLGNGVDLIIDGGRSPLGRESTVVQVLDEGYRILRSGAISAGDLASAAGPQLAERRT